MSVRSFSFGGGVQSMAVLVLAAQKRVQYDVFLFANVGEDSENPATMKYLEEYAEPYAEENGIILRRVQKTIGRGAEKRPDSIIGRINRSKRSLPIPVRMSNGAPASRTCTVDHKIKPIERILRTVYKASKENPATVGLGISTDEIHRARTDSGFNTQVLEYPLIDLLLNRRDCMRIIEEAGLPVPPKSSCFFCPFHSKSEWQRMKHDEPELFAKSVDLENLLNERRSDFGKNKIYFHSSLVSLENAVGDQMTFDDLPETDFCESGYCMT